jgi:AraC-like DNA-binding protein
MKENPHIDVLSDILRATRLYASSYFCKDFAAPWGLSEPATESGAFHVVVRGTASVTTSEQDKPIYLSAGDIIAFPTGLAHQIFDESASNIMHGPEVLSKIKQGHNPFIGSEKVTTLLCGYFHYDKKILLPLLRDMPTALHIKSESGSELIWLNYLVKSLANESQYPQPGSSVVIDRLTEVLVIQLLRWHINHQKTAQGYFKALSDRQLNEALHLMHKHPERTWTVESLAGAVNMSRSAFANHFSNIVGMTPLAYLRQWRMQVASELLIDSSEFMSTIAEKVGYKSESSFGKAFKSTTGVSPGLVRKLGQKAFVRSDATVYF